MFGITAMLVAALVFSTSCDRNAHLDERCNNGTRFSPRVEGGPCDRCAVEDGYIRLGRDGQFCYEPGEYGGEGAALRLLTWETPPPNTPVDSFIFDIDPTTSSTPQVTYSRSGNFHAGEPNRDEWEMWGIDSCHRAGDQRLFGCCSFIDLDLSSNDTLLPNGTRFTFEMLDFDVNRDCVSDWGHVVGEFADGRGVATVYWRPFIPGQRYDTIRIDTLYLDPLPPEWL